MKTLPPSQNVDWDALRPQVTDTLLAEMTARLVETFQPEAIILFGSYAYGTPHKDSDLDLLVIMDSEESMAKRIMRVSPIARVRFLPMDLLVYTSQEIEERRQLGDPFILEVLSRGKVLYRRDAPR